MSGIGGGMNCTEWFPSLQHKSGQLWATGVAGPTPKYANPISGYKSQWTQTV